MRMHPWLQWNNYRMNWGSFHKMLRKNYLVL